MKNRFLAMAAVLLCAAGLLVAFYLLGPPAADGTRTVLAAPAAATVTQVDPLHAPNDLDVSIVITGTGFAPGAAASLGATPLHDVTWLSDTSLTAVVPWGITPDVYTVTVENSDGQTGSLPGAFTVTQGIGVWNATELYGGATHQVVVHPQTQSTVYAVSEDVGMFRSDDGAATWTLKVAGGEYGTRNLAIDPSSPEVVYLYQPFDLYRSDDGGDTWTPLNAPGDIPFPHPADTGTVFVSNRWEGQSGLWKSEDYGQTWLTATKGLTDTRINNLVFDPVDPSTIYVGTEQGNLFMSSDGGATWGFLAQPLEYIQALAINPRGDHELWVSNCCFCQPPMTLRSTDAGHTTWEAVPAPVGSMTLRSIEFAPDEWGAAYAQRVFVSDCWGAVERSDDNGASWMSVSPQPGESHDGLGLDPTDPSVLYATGSKQGIYKTTDEAASWSVANEGLTAVVPEHLTTIAGQPDALYAVTDLGLMKGTDGGAAWQTLPVGGGVNFVVTDPFTPDRVYAAGDVGMGEDLPVYISEDGGQNWPTTGYLPTPPEYDGYAHLDPIIEPGPSLPGVLLAGVRHWVIDLGGAEAGSLYRSENAGLTWAEVDLGQEISPVQDIAFDVVSPTIVYVATSGDAWDDGSGLWRSADSGTTWQQVGASIAEMDEARSIAVEPRPPYRVFVLTSSRVYVSPDRGLTWTQTNIQHGAIESLLSSHDLPHSILYMSSSLGLFRSIDGGDSWTRATGPLGHVPVYSLAEAVTDDRSILYAGTVGGVVENGLAANQTSIASMLVDAGVYRYTTRLDWSVYLPIVVKGRIP